MWLTLQHRLYTRAYHDSQEGTHATAIQTVLAVLEQHARANAKQLHDAVGTARAASGSKQKPTVAAADEATRAAFAMFAQA